MDADSKDINIGGLCGNEYISQVNALKKKSIPSPVSNQAKKIKNNSLEALLELFSNGLQNFCIKKGDPNTEQKLAIINNIFFSLCGVLSNFAVDESLVKKMAGAYDGFLGKMEEIQKQSPPKVSLPPKVPKSIAPSPVVIQETLTPEEAGIIMNDYVRQIVEFRGLVNAYQQISGMADDKAMLDKQMHEAETALAQIAQENTKPNPAVRSDGNCLFDSAFLAHEQPVNPSSALTSAKNTTYRQLTAEKLREHRDDPLLKIEIENMLENDAHVKAAVSQLLFKAGGKEGYMENFFSVRERLPEPIDLYCDAMKDETQKLYAGTPEMQALSDVLGVPIIIIGPPKPGEKQWKLSPLTILPNELKPGVQPIFIHFNGLDHYQNLIPRV